MSQPKKYAIKCLHDEAQAILDLIPQLTDDFDQVVDLIYHCRGRVLVTGVGKSGHVGAKIASTLASTGTPSFIVQPLDAFHGDLGMFTPEDVVLASSNSGNTDELLRFVPSLIDRNIPIVGVTGNPDSLLGKASKYILQVKVDHEACPLGLAPTSSTTATLAMGDALACALMEVRNYKATDFARFHPGGSLGKRLLTRVKDTMVSTNLPIVSPATKVSDAIYEISKNKQGIAIAIEGDNIVGVITDGDVRRAMYNKQSEFFTLCVADIMSTNPKTISHNAKLSEAEALMRKYNIHSLVVVDDAGQLVGCVDSFSILI